MWWDHHDWGAAMRVPAVVGSFPEPFVNGAEGKKLPVRIDCADDAARDVPRGAQAARGRGREGRRLGDARHARRAGGAARARRPWSEVRGDPAARRLEQGPAGVGRVRAADAGGRREFELLDARGQPVRTLGAGSGLVAATRVRGQQPTWVVTGTDDVGVASAAAALVETRLRDHFAVAIDGGREVPLPLPATAAAESSAGRP